MKTNYFFIIVVLLLLLLPFSEAKAHYNTFGKLIDADDCLYYYIDPGANYGSVIPSTWRPYIGLAALDWSSQSSKVELHSTSVKEDAHNYIYRSNRISEIACTVYAIDGNNNILCWDIAFNQYDNFYTNGNKYDVKTVALHEFGHSLGIGHVGWSLLTDTKAHIMYYTYTKAKSLHAHDIDALILIYGS